MKIRHIPALAAALAGLVSTLAAQQPAPAPVPGTADPFIKTEPVAVADPFSGEPARRQPARLVSQGIVRLEYFSLPHNLARKVLRQFPQHQALYDWLGKELDDPNSEVKLERLTLLKVRGGQRSKVEEINEYPYATEYDPPQIPQSIGIGAPLMVSNSTNTTNVTPPPAPTPAPTPPAPAPAPPRPAPVPPGPQGAPGDPGAAAPPAVITPGAVPANHVTAPWPYTPTTASAFTFKNTGWTFEVELTFGEDGHMVDLNIAPEHIKLIGLMPQNPSGEIVQPVFETNKLTGQILAYVNRPTLAGTISPPVATGPAGANTVNRTWLLFLTVTPAR